MARHVGGKRAAHSSRCFAKSLSLNDDAKKLQMSAMKACFQIAECSFFLCKDTTFLRVNYTLMGIGRKKVQKNDGLPLTSPHVEVQCLISSFAI